jgi:hypothetical protein
MCTPTLDGLLFKHEGLDGGGKQITLLGKQATAIILQFMDLSQQ